MPRHTIVLLPGDGIGPEIITQARGVLDCLIQDHGLEAELDTAAIGGAAYETLGDPLPADTLARTRAADAVLLGAVGGPQYESLPRDKRPERGLLGIRSELGLFANLRPAVLFPALASASSLREEVVSGLDLLIIRELTGGIYFGAPRGMETDGAERVAFNTMRYREHEIRRIADVAFQAARRRRGRVCSVDKANVLEVSELWRETVEHVARDYPDVELSHMYVDNAAMQLVRQPKQFDVMVTGNLFGDILSDEAAMLTGSIGMLPSASLGASGQGLYEPIHGSAPDIAGRGVANPLAAILSVAMLLRHSLHRPELAERVEHAVEAVLAAGLRTADLDPRPGADTVSTEAMGRAVVEHLTGTA